MVEAVDSLRPNLQGVIIEVTSKCNLRCTYCTKANDAYDALPFVNTDLSDETLARLHRHCKDSGIRQVSLSGVGETAIFAGWERRLAAFLDDPDLTLYLVSNLTRPLNEADLAALLKFAVLQVSFDSADVETVRAMRSKARLSFIVDNIRRLKGAIAAAGRGPELLVNCTLSRQNVGHVAGLARLSRSLGVDRLLVGEMMPNNPDTPLEILGDLPAPLAEALRADLREASQVLGDRFVVQRRLELRLHDVSGSLPVSPCSQPWDTPFVRSDGKVFPCCCYGDHFAPLGDLASGSLAEIYAAEPSRRLRARLLAGEPALPCARCTLAGTLSHADFVKDIEGRLTPPAPGGAGAGPAALPDVRPVVPLYGADERFPVSRQGLVDWRRSPSFARVAAAYRSYPETSLQSDEARALLHHLIVMTRPERVLEIGTWRAGTTEVLARALVEAGRGRLDTIDPFGAASCPPLIAALPDALRERIDFHPVNSAAYFDQAINRGHFLDFVLIDGSHELEFALFDLTCCARLLRPNGLVVLDNIEQPGPRFATRAFLADNPQWIDVAGVVGGAPDAPFAEAAASFPDTKLYVLQAPPYFVVGAVPRSFGAINGDFAAVEGIELEPAATARGTLHVEVILRTFGGTVPEERAARRSLVLPGRRSAPVEKLRLAFDRPLLGAPQADGLQRRIEIVLAFSGREPLALARPPLPYPARYV